MSGLLLRRRQMMMQAPKEDYIKNGLIFQLDGYDAANSSWVDRIGSREFTLTDCTVDSNHGVVFNGTSSQAVNYSQPFAGATIEAAIKLNSSPLNKWHPIFGQLSKRGEENIILYLTNDYRLATRATDSSATQRYYAYQQIMALSAYQDGSDARVNGDATTASSSNLAPYNYADGLILIGRRTLTGSTRLNGVIYAIRIYDRKLTVDEMLHNQRLDNKRFNLGLTI